jgi:hypothetical protein
VRHPFLIVQSWMMMDSLFHIYDLTNYELKSAFGVIGQGPVEFILPELFLTQLPDILIGDISTNFVYWFGISEDGQPVFKKSIRPNNIYSIWDAAFINDSLYVVDAKYDERGNALLLNFQDEEPKQSWKRSNLDIKKYKDSDMGYVYAHESRIAFCYGYKKQIDIMDTDFNLIKRVKFKYTHPVNISAYDEEEVKMSYITGYLGKRYLYALFLGTSWNEHRADSLRGTFLEVFDLEGNPVVRYNLDGIGPVNYVVDEETFTLYGTGVDGDPEDYLVVYKLNGLF